MVKFRMYRYTVEGAGTFPYDMLRYDESHPDQQADSLGLAVPDNYTDKRAVTLIRIIMGASSWHPCADRWQSFLWRVTDVQEID